MEISGLLTEDLPTRNSTQMSPMVHQYMHALPPSPQQYYADDDLKVTHFVCATHARLPLRLELRPTLTSADLDILIRTFFGLKPGDTIAYVRGNQSLSSVTYEDCLVTSEFQIHVTPDLRYQQHPFAPSQANVRHPSAHISGYGGPLRAQLLSAAAAADSRSSSPSGRGRRSGSTNGLRGRSRSLKRVNSRTNLAPPEKLIDELMYEPRQYTPGDYVANSASDQMLDGDGKLESVASADISLDNIVEGSRRKRAKFSSSELPLFSKPLYPASYSPTRAANPPQATTPMNNCAQNYYQIHTPNSASPYTYNQYHQQTPHYYSGRPYGPNFPTPAPTVATDISDEDVALTLMHLAGTSTHSRSPSNDQTAEEAGEYSEDQGDEGRSDTTELPQLPPPVDEEREALKLIQGSPSYPRKQAKYKSLNEILPSYDSTIPSDNEDTQPRQYSQQQQQQQQQSQYMVPVVKQETAQIYNAPHGHYAHLHQQRARVDSADEEEFDCDDAKDETFAPEDEDSSGWVERRPLIHTNHGAVHRHSITGAFKAKRMGAAAKNSGAKSGAVKTGRVSKPQQQKIASKPKPKATPTLNTAFTGAGPNMAGKGPLSPASPIMNRHHSISSVYSQPQKSRSTTASAGSLPTPISGIMPGHSEQMLDNRVMQQKAQAQQPMGYQPFPALTGPMAPTNSVLHSTPTANDDPNEKPKPRCQRCRKSKKGCNRQRPCQRCKDAGIGIEGCISEDEAGTRRGRVGGGPKKTAGTGTGGILGVPGVKKVVKKPKKLVIVKV